MSRGVGLRSGSRAKLCLVSAIAGGVALPLLAVGWVAQVAAQGMALPGKFEVTPTGAANYTVPIAVPPGTAGMVPSLSIAYNSQARNGLLGVGWHLEGLPSVGRCPRNIAQDGVRGSVNYDADDRFCLDGQRLVAISGAYGADGTEYRTEIESFSKAISRGTAGTGPAWFEVWTKSGQRMEFGNTTDSRVLVQGKTVARDWVVNKVSDTAGNYFTVTYVNDTTNGQVYPSRIDYTGNVGAGLTPYNSVRFIYDTARPDVVPAYHLGSLQKTTVRLAKVQTYAGSTMVADYRLAYEQSPITERSRLTSLTLCTGGGSCLPATTFAWQTGTVTPNVVTNVAGKDGTLSGYRPYLGDFNGDGLTDIMWDQSGSSSLPSSSGTRVLWTGTGTGNFTVTSNFAGQDGQLSGYAPAITDLNRDGRSDVLWHGINSSGQTTGLALTWISSSTGGLTAGPVFQVPVTVGRLAFLRGFRFIDLPDFNGDARSDLLWANPTVPRTVTIYITKAGGTFGVTTLDACRVFGNSDWDGCSLTGVTADLNGDGLTDLVWATTSSVSGKRLGLMQSKGDGTFTTLPEARDDSLHAFSPYFADINGDGSIDVVWDKIDSSGRSVGERRLWLGKSDGTFIGQTNLAGKDGTLVGYRPNLGDFNGDGLADLLWVQTDTNGLSSGARELWLGKGDGTFTVPTGQANPPTGYVPVTADFNGDGKADILWDKRSGSDTRSQGQRILWLSDGVVPDLLTSVTTGVGASVAVTYKPLTDSTVYTKGDSAVDPVIDLSGAMSVVARVDMGNGIGGVVSTGYAYAGAKAHLDGRGFLGFQQMTVTDLQTNLVGTTTYRQDYPYISLVAAETKKIGTVTLSSTGHAYEATALSGTRFQVSLKQSQSLSADLDGSKLPGVTSSYQYDTHGNATQIVVSSADGFSKTTTNNYANDTGKWLLGRLTRASVTSLVTTPTPLPTGPTEVVISASTNNLNLWDYILASGLGNVGAWKVTIASGVVIGSASTAAPALDTGLFPSGSVLTVTNNGTIVGAGGKGGNGGSCPPNETGIPGGPGAAGGIALRMQTPVTMTNNGSIWGGGGGGGGGATALFKLARLGGGGGGGGAGTLPGAGGDGGDGEGTTPGASGATGSPSSGGAGGSPAPSAGPGGAGGGPGLPGSPGMVGNNSCVSNPTGAGGAAGPAVIGNSLITWQAVGDRKGPLN